MDSSKIITILVWGTIAVVFYEAYRAVTGTTAAAATPTVNPLGVPTTTGNAALDAQLFSQGLSDYTSGSGLTASQPVTASGGMAAQSITDPLIGEADSLGGY
jgi:hypothetical protein